LSATKPNKTWSELNPTYITDEHRTSNVQHRISVIYSYEVWLFAARWILILPLSIRVRLHHVVDDPDAPKDVWDHWVAYDISPEAVIPEGVSNLGTGGRNSWGRTGYGGPCPPPGGSHRYIFSVYAIDTTLGLCEGVDKGAVLNAIQGHILDEAELIGRYSR